MQSSVKTERIGKFAIILVIDKYWENDYVINDIRNFLNLVISYKKK